MADENVEFHVRHIVPNIKSSVKTGFKELKDTLSEGVSALLPFAAMAADPLLAFGLGGIKKGFSGLFSGEKTSVEKEQSDELKETIKLRERENEIRKMQLAEEWKAWEKINQTLIDEDRTSTSNEQATIDAAEQNITSLETALADSIKELNDVLEPKMRDLTSLLAERGDEDKEFARLQNMSGKGLSKEIIKLQKQQKDLFSGSPPYLQTISEYLEHFQWPLLTSISTALGNQETLSNALVQMEKDENSIKEDPPVSQDYFTKTQQPILESISKSFEGMLNLQIKEGRFSEENKREGEGEGKFGWLKDLFGKKEKKKGDGLFGFAKGLIDKFLGIFDLGGKAGFTGLFMGALGKIFPKVAGMTNPVTALALGLMWAVIDGFKGWAKAEEWGVSKVSGAIGGFFGGTADGGIKNAFMQSGKWALIGAGLGSVVPVVGTLIGGLIGAAIGGLLGWVGGEKIAQAMDKVGGWFKDTWNNSVEFLKESWTKFSGWIGGIWESVTGWFKEKWEQTKALPGKAIESVKEGWDKTTEIVGNATSSLGSFIAEKASGPIEATKEAWTATTDKMSGMFNIVGGWFEGVWSKILGLFSLEKLPCPPIDIPKLLIDLWNSMKGVIVGWIPEWIPGAKKKAMDALGVTQSDLEGTTGTQPVTGQTAYQGGAENRQLTTTPAAGGVLAQTNALNVNNTNQSSSIFTAPNTYDPMMETMTPGYQP